MSKQKECFSLSGLLPPLAFASKLDWYIWPIQPTRSLVWAERLIWVSWRSTMSAPSDLRWEKTLARFTTCPKPLQFQLTIFIPPGLLLGHYVAFLILEQIVAVIQSPKEKRPAVRELVMPPVLINVNIKHRPHPPSRPFTEWLPQTKHSLTNTQTLGCLDIQLELTRHL